MNLLEECKKIAKLVCDSELEQLRMEEELLINLVRAKKITNLKLKTKAFERMNEINKRQMSLVGSTLK